MKPLPPFPPRFITWLEWRISTLDWYVRRKMRDADKHAAERDVLRTVRLLYIERRKSPDPAIRVWQWWVYWQGIAYYLWANDWDNPDARQYRSWLTHERDRRLEEIKVSFKRK